MTHYWWMHWFWITLVFEGIFTVTLPESSSPNSTTETTMHFVNATTIINKPNNTVNTVLPQTTQPPTIVAFKGTKKLKLLLSSPKNISAKSYNGTKELKNKNVAVIKTNFTKPKEEAIMTTISFQNETENVTYMGEGLNWNQSFVQNSERIAMEEKVQSSESSTSNLSAAGITGITLGCVMVVGMISGVSLFFYRYHRFNRPQVLNDRCSNPDSSGYIDDASIRDNSEEMYSLDNDSFLNSLEAMTIQNYWTDTVKHTKL